MATSTKKRNQHGLQDKRINDAGVRAEVEEAFASMEEHRDAHADYVRAQKAYAKLIEPFVQECEVGDGLEVCDGLILKIKPYARDAFEVEAYEKKRGVPLEGDD